MDEDRLELVISNSNPSSSSRSPRSSSLMTSDHFRFSAAAAMEAALLEAVIEAVAAAVAATVAILLLLRLLSALLLPLLLSARPGLASVEATTVSFLFLAAKVVDDEDIDFSFLDGDFFFRLVSCS